MMRGLLKLPLPGGLMRQILNLQQIKSLDYQSYSFAQIGGFKYMLHDYDPSSLSVQCLPLKSDPFGLNSYDIINELNMT